MNALFVLARIVTGLTSVIACVLLSLVVLLRDTASTAKEGFSALGYVARLFATGFTDATTSKTVTWHIGLWQIILGLLSLAMLVSVFTPGSRWFLNSVAALAGGVIIGYAKMIFTGPRLKICLPFLIVWIG
jgi:hypothetical protein